MRAADIMIRELITVTPDTTIAALSDLFRDRQITGAPVIDEAGRLVGIVSKDDVVFRARRRAETPSHHDIKSLLSAGFVGFSPGGAEAVRVSEIMTRDVLSASEDESIEQLCRLMWEKRVHRVPIVRDAVLVGIVTALDICKSVANGALAGR